MLKVEGLVKRYGGKKVVDGVSLEIGQGQVVGLLGPNGAGKTTTFHIIAGLITPERGKVFLGDKEISHLPFHRRARMGIHYLPQEPSVFRKLTVLENLMVVLEGLNANRREKKKRAKELLKKLFISDLAYRKAYTLSSGERRRVELARALATSPLFLLLDEPFSGIDPISVEEIQQIIRSFKGEGLGIVVTDHNVRETLKVTDFAYLIYEGKILMAGTPYQLAQNEMARKFYLGEDFQF
jgi:lipopolysaccharide export system ATP-binding protein